MRRWWRRGRESSGGVAYSARAHILIRAEAVIMELQKPRGFSFPLLLILLVIGWGQK